MNNKIDLPKQEVTDQLIEDFLFTSHTELSKEQKKLFLTIAKMHQLNPFAREIHAIPRGGELSIVIGYEVYLKRAENSAQWDGEEPPLFEGSLNEVSIEKRVWNKESKCYKSEQVKVLRGDLRCTMKVYRKDMNHPITKTVYYNEYTQDNQIWKEKPNTMLEKVCTAQLYRKAFPKEIGGMPYTADELPIQEGKGYEASIQENKTTEKKVSEKELKAIATILEKTIGTKTENYNNFKKYVFKTDHLSNINSSQVHYFFTLINNALNVEKFDFRTHMTEENILLIKQSLLELIVKNQIEAGNNTDPKEILYGNSK